MNAPRNTRLPRVSTVIAGVALFAALGGSATAATGLISGKGIKDGSVTGKDIKRGSLGTKQLSKKSLKALKGATGAKGSTGSTGATGAGGAQGAQGAQGPNGVVNPLSAVDSSENIDPNGVVTPIVGKVLPAGTYVVTAKTTLFAADNDQVDCSLMNGATTVDTISWNNGPPVANRRTPASLTAVVTSTGGLVRLTCGKSSAVAGGTSDSKLIAIPVS